MQKLRTFFRTLLLSCTSPEYYADILKAKFSFSLSYLIFFTLLLSLVTTAKVVIPLAVFDVRETITSLQQDIPRGVILTLDEGRLSINQPLPYKIAIPGEKEIDTDLQYVVVFESDENVQGMSDVVAQNSLAVVTQTALYFRKDDAQGKYETYYFGDSKESGSLSSEQVNQLIDQVKNHPFIAKKLYIPVIGIFLLLFITFFSVIGALIGAAVYGVAVLIMSRLLATQIMAGQLLSYSKAVQVTIHSSTLLILLQTLLNTLVPGHPFQGILYFVAFLGWTAFLLSKAHTPQSTPVNKLPPEQPIQSIDRVEDPL